MTIVVLLILAGITISLVFSDNGIIAKAREAAEKTNQAVINEQAQMNELADYMENMINTIGGGNTTESPTIPEGLEIGSTISYNPSGTYNWQAKYCSSTKTEGTDDVQLNSATGENFNISSWKVLSIDEKTGTIELVPSSSTTGTVYLEEAQGYNNGVKLLNDACSSLYGNIEKGISARSINLEDIEKYMTEEALLEAHSYTPFGIKYGNQVSSAYTNYKNYPAIYAQEKLAVIDGKSNGDTGLDISEQKTFIERTEGTRGAITTNTNIQPYQTSWNEDATGMSTAFKDYKEGANYYSLIIPRGIGTTYWIASRYIDVRADFCSFYVCFSMLGDIRRCKYVYFIWRYL